MMHNRGFMKGLIVGGIIGASMSMMMDGNSKKRSKRKMMNESREFLRKSGRVIGDVVDLFR